MSDSRQDRAARAEQMRLDRERADKRQRLLITAAIVVVLVALIAAAAFAVRNASTSDDAAPVVTPPGTTSAFGVAYTPEDAGASTSNSTDPDPVPVVLYEDLQCPACAYFMDQNGAALDKLVADGEITLEYRLLTFLKDRSANEYSSRAANAALCTYTEGGPSEFVELVDTLYANQPEEYTAGPSNEALLKRVQDSGVQGADDCVLDERYVGWLDKATDQMDAAGVRGTPTVFVDGKALDELDMASIRQAISDAREG